MKIASFGPLVRDTLFLNGRGLDSALYVGARGGGSAWNALVNARAHGTPTVGYPLGGLDAAGRECIEDLRAAGVTVPSPRLVPGKNTRTLHEILQRPSSSRAPGAHEYAVKCPVCGSETYNLGTVKISALALRDAARALKAESENDLLIHIDGLDQTRIDIINSIKSDRRIVSLDLGRGTGLFRMRQTGLLGKLRSFDILFVHPRALTELQQSVGSDSPEELVLATRSRLLVVPRGDKGVDFWNRVGESVVDRHQDASIPERIVDSAGAGDALVGRLLSLIATGSPKGCRELLGDADEIAKRLRLAQDWAAFKLGFPGARGHIAGSDGRPWSWDALSPRIRGRASVRDLQDQNLSRSRCAVCDSSLSSVQHSVTVAVRYRQNVEALPSRVEGSWKRRKSSSWPLLADLEGPGYVVGTGGSFVAATFVAQLLSMSHQAPVVPLRPFDFARTATRTEFVVFVSQTGQTADILTAAKHAYTVGAPKVLVITAGKPNAEALGIPASKFGVLSTYGEPERGFLSVAGVVVPCFLALAALEPTTWKDELGYLQFSRLFRDALNDVGHVFGDFQGRRPNRIAGKRVLILGGGFGWPAMLDLESKMLEGNLGAPQVSELKDYSHGRFVSSIDKRGIAIVLGMPDDHAYRDLLVRKLLPRNNVIEIVTEHLGSLGGLDLLVKVEHLIRMLSESEGVDISKPTVPAVGLDLYRYPDILDSFNGSKANTIPPKESM